VEALLRFMDADADGRCSLREVNGALWRAHQDASAAAAEATAAQVMARLEAEMHGRGANGRKLRVRDLFTQLDADGSGSARAVLRDGGRKINKAVGVFPRAQLGRLRDSSPPQWLHPGAPFLLAQTFFFLGASLLERSITSAELRRGLAGMLGPSTAERFAAKQASEKAARRQAKNTSKVNH
jgi:hypothetical protein